MGWPIEETNGETRTEGIRARTLQQKNQSAKFNVNVIILNCCFLNMSDNVRRFSYKKKWINIFVFSYL